MVRCVLRLDVPCPASQFSNAVHRLRAGALLVRRCVRANAGRCIPRGKRPRERVHSVSVRRFRLPGRRGLAAVRAVRRILAELEFPVLSDLGFVESDLDGLADLALADYFITMSPEPWSKDEVVTAFTSALQLGARAA